MKCFFDTEFIEDGRTIDLLSIGIVREDGATYYAEPAEADRSRASDWVRENVLPSLTGPVKTRSVIAAEIAAFVGDGPEWWAYYADYDWVALCQLYGTMMDIPGDWPGYCHDLRQHLDENGFGGVSPSDSVHNALGDAEWVRATWFDRRYGMTPLDQVERSPFWWVGRLLVSTRRRRAACMASGTHHPALVDLGHAKVCSGCGAS